MKLLPSFIALVLSLAFVAATGSHDHLGISARHNSLARRNPLESRAAKRCPNRVFNKGTNTTNTNNVASNNSTAPTNGAAGGSDQGSPAGKVITVMSKCGPPGASTTISKLTGPNGSIDYLNCGIDKPGGWTPPEVHISDLVTQSLHTALQKPNSPFKACAPYIQLFEQYANQYGIPPIIMASFSMQESGCNPSTVGGGGEQGMMQITQEKCKNAPGGNCKDPAYNIQTATKFFADTLASHNGNIILSVAGYNGWFAGMTIADATRAADTACCRCQNNLDYLHQFFNAWLQNENAYGLKLGKYFNLAVCGKSS